MTESIPQDLQDRLNAFGQAHVVHFWSQLTDEGRRNLVAQLHRVDFAQIRTLWENAVRGAAETESPQDRARRALPPADVVELPTNNAAQARWDAARARGNELLAGGRVGVIIVAGGEGTRLQFPHPKGLYPVGPVSGRTLFEWLVGQLAARSRRSRAAIPLYVMTSDATHEETVAHFVQHGWYGLPEKDVHFFRQGTMPVVNLADGRLLLAAPDAIAVSPDGHGGLVAALQREGLVDDMRRRNLKHVFYMQVDNPTVIACDPEFLGFHDLAKSDLSTKVVAKRTAKEKMGVVCQLDGKAQIIEYSDMPDDIAARTVASGRLEHWAGNTAIHAFSVGLLERLANDAASLPFHIARKHVPHFNQEGCFIEPTPDNGPPNGCKFEKFIFDALPLAERALVVQADRAREFNPIKDRTGENSPEASRQAMTRIFRSWLQAAGVEVPDDADVEISPHLALDMADMIALGKPEIERRIARRQTAKGIGWVLE